MLPLAADEDFNGRIVRGLRRRIRGIDLVTVQEAGLKGRPDPEVLEWAASQGRVLVTQDKKTMVAHAIERVKTGQPMPGLIIRLEDFPIGESIEQLELIAECGEPADFRDQVKWLPLE